LPSLTRSGSNGRSAVADADLQAAIDRGITVAEVTYSNSISVSEHVVVMILGLVRNYIPSYQWVVKGGWHIAEYLTRSYDVEGMHAGTVAAGRIALRCFAGSSPSTCIFIRVSVLIPHFVLAKIMITVGLMMMHGRMMTSWAC
jgi:hypothetical protein